MEERALKTERVACSPPRFFPIEYCLAIALNEKRTFRIALIDCHFYFGGHIAVDG